MRANEIPELGRLSVAEKILLVEDLWDSIASDEASVPVPASHVEELERRLSLFAAEPGRLLTLAELRRRIEQRK